MDDSNASYLHLYCIRASLLLNGRKYKAVDLLIATKYNCETYWRKKSIFFL